MWSLAEFYLTGQGLKKAKPEKAAFLLHTAASDGHEKSAMFVYEARESTIGVCFCKCLDFSGV